jgi:hypothetical protein
MIQCAIHKKVPRLYVSNCEDLFRILICREVSNNVAERNIVSVLLHMQFTKLGIVNSLAFPRMLLKLQRIILYHVDFQGFCRGPRLLTCAKSIITEEVLLIQNQYVPCE